MAPVEPPPVDQAPDHSQRLPGSLQCRLGAEAFSDYVRADDRLQQAGVRLTGLSKRLVRRVIRTHVPAVKDCYEEGFAEPPYPRGRVLTRITIAPDGSVAHSCLVDSTLQQEKIERCIPDEILEWKFPKPIANGWVMADYPWVLVPSRETPEETAP